jgi:hypothetical protein
MTGMRIITKMRQIMYMFTRTITITITKGRKTIPMPWLTAMGIIVTTRRRSNLRCQRAITAMRTNMTMYIATWRM